MSVRRQGFKWTVADLGNLPPKDIELLENRPQSVFYSKIGTATITNRLTTKGDEFLVLQYIGSTPGIYGLANNWKPGGFVNIVVESTAYYQTLDGRDAQGMSGTAAPYPISSTASPVLQNWIPIEIPPGTNWNVTYFISNALVEPIEAFPSGDGFSWTTTGA